MRTSASAEQECECECECAWNVNYEHVKRVKKIDMLTFSEESCCGCCLGRSQSRTHMPTFDELVDMCVLNDNLIHTHTHTHMHIRNVMLWYRSMAGPHA